MCIKVQFALFVVDRFGSMEGFTDHALVLFQSHRQNDLNACRVLVNYLRNEDYCAFKTYLHDMDLEAFDRVMSEFSIMQVSYLSELIDLLKQIKEQLPNCVKLYS